MPDIDKLTEQIEKDLDKSSKGNEQNKMKLINVMQLNVLNKMKARFERLFNEIADAQENINDKKFMKDVKRLNKLIDKNTKRLDMERLRVITILAMEELEDDKGELTKDRLDKMTIQELIKTLEDAVLFLETEKKELEDADSKPN